MSWHRGQCTVRLEDGNYCPNDAERTRQIPGSRVRPKPMLFCVEHSPVTLALAEVDAPIDTGRIFSPSPDAGSEGRYVGRIEGKR